MTPVLVLAYDGRIDPARAIAALAQFHTGDVVTMTVDIGQSGDVRAIRDRALTGGAARAHVFDAVDDFVRQCVLPALQSAQVSLPAITSSKVAYPLIAARLVEVARIEGARVVAHAGSDALSAQIRALDPSLQVLTLDATRMSHARAARAVPARHLLQRPVADPAVARGMAARVEIEFDEAVPVAINGVTLTLSELVESLSLIGGEHGIGHAESADAPGALVLDAAYRALNRRSGIVRIELLDGRQRILANDDRTVELVNHA